MRIEIYIPDDDIPKGQELVNVCLHFMDGQICECDYPFTINGEDENPKADVLDKIRAELEKNTEKWWYGTNSSDCFVKLSYVLGIIDNHRA